MYINIIAHRLNKKRKRCKESKIIRNDLVLFKKIAR